MKRFLFKFFFVLFALIAALPAQANYVFFKNTVNWSNVYVYFYNGSYWSDTQGSGSNGIASGPNGMSKVYGMEDIYAYDYNGNYSQYISFTKDSQKGYNNFNNTAAVYRSDFSFSSPLYTPETTPSGTLNNSTTPYYNNGTWSTINWSDYTYWIKHDFGGNNNWTWVDLTSNGDGTYSKDAVYGGGGCNYSTKENDGEAPYIGSPTLVGGPKKGDNCTFTFNPFTKTITITKKALVQLAAPTFSPAGGTFTSAQSVTISAAEGAKIYYTTNKTVPTTSSTEYSGPITVNETTTLRAIAVKEGYTNSEIAEATYTINTPTPTNYTYALHGQITGNTQWESTAMTDEGNGIWSLTRNFVKGEFGIKEMDANGQVANGWLGWSLIGDPKDNCEAGSGSNIKLTADGNYTISFNTTTRKITVKENGTAGEIPVYPAGVNSEAELSAYDFEANPVYYLLADVLNDNRVTPEWQLTKGADGLYHLNGFAMRNTGAVKVRQYTSAGTYVDYASQEFTNLSSEGQLYNATFDPTNNSNSLTLAKASDSKLPFISLVGYMMQQDQVYDTPRGVEKTPEGTKTSKGWQEAWLLYDANGKLLKDRKGNVMYSTMWPPKNPVYFTATISENNQRLYSSDQMTFVPVKDADGNNVGKTGAEWKAELKKLDEEAYKGLDLVNDKTYYRYVVSDIWYVGAGKIWTGWGGETTYDNNKQIANWSKHKNWGYSDKNATDTDGTPINAQTTYNVTQSAGNFLFNDPTYFKTFEFFYETGKPNENSQIYTTLAYGSASIAAQNVKEGDSYTKGSYQAKVSLPEGSGVTVSSWTITRYDATTNKLAPIGSDNAVVATGENTDPTSDTFTEDADGLGEGRYYYELTVTFSNGRTSTVNSNPFVIYYPNQYSVDANGYQLVKLDKATDDGYSYVTYNAKANGDLYFVNLTTDNKVANFRVATSAERETVNGYFAANSDIKWTDKVFVYAPVPAEFKVDAEETNATVSLEKIVSYNVNNTSGVPPVKYELAVVDNKGNFANKVYKAVMNYKEKDIATGNWSETAKTSLGKENLTVMQMPNVKAKASIVNVTKIKNSEVLNIIDGDTTKQKACNYYEVTLELNFDDPNVITAKAPRFKIGDKVYECVNADTRSITIACVNPLDFANAASDITVDAVYYDGTDYTLPATIGEAAVLKADDAKFQVLAHPQITSVHAITSKMPREHVVADVVAVTEMHTTITGADKIGETALEDEYYNVEFAIDDHETPDFSQILTKDDINFTGVLEDKGDYKIWSKFHVFDNTTRKDNVKFRAEVTPMYVAHVTNQASTKNLRIISGETHATAEGTYVALNGNPANYIIEGSIQTGVTDINTLAPRARKVIENGEIHIICGDRKYNVMGAEIR